MFCPNCGTKAVEGAEFCQKCGAKLTAAPPEPPAAAPAPAPAPDSAPKQKKKKSKLPIILGGVVVILLIAAAVFIALNWEGEINFESTVRAHQPFYRTEDLPYSYGEVFDRYLPDAQWTVRESGDTGYVDISGKAAGTGKKVSVSIKVTPDPKDSDRAKISPVSVSIGREETSEDDDISALLFALFTAYDEDIDDPDELTELLEGLESAWSGDGTPSEAPEAESDPPAEESSGPFPLALLADAAALFDQWTADHPLHFDYYMDLVSDDWLDDGGNSSFLFDILSEGTAVFSISVRKSDGYMQFINQYGSMSVDEWYEEWYADSGDSSSQFQELLFTMDGDDYSTFTLREDGTFSMDVNLYAGVGTLFGSCWDVDYGIKCAVEVRDFQGYMGDNVSEFEMLYGDGCLIFHGEDIGTTSEGATYSPAWD